MLGANIPLVSPDVDRAATKLEEELVLYVLTWNLLESVALTYKALTVWHWLDAHGVGGFTSRILETEVDRHCWRTHVCCAGGLCATSQYVEEQVTVLV